MRLALFLNVPEIVEHKVSPFGKMNIQLADMTSNTGISLHSLEKEFTYQESLQPSKSKPEYWNCLGSSKSRSGEQEMLSREIIEGLLETCDRDTAVAFKDGSCLGNPGPCGAGACVFLPDKTDPTFLKQPVSCRGSILLGELVAIKIVVNHIFNTEHQRNTNQIKKLHVFSDSQCAIGHLTLGWEANSHKATIFEVKSDIQKLKEAGVEVEISWTPGHADIKGNDQADRLAKEAAQEAKEMSESELPSAITLCDVKMAAKTSGFKKWQERWEKAETGRDLFDFRPRVDFKIKHVFDSASGERVVAQLRTGYAKLNEYLHKVSVVDCNKCQCGEIESVSHYLLFCPLYEKEREIMRKRLSQNCGIVHFDLNVLLDARKEDEFKDWRSAILTELETYVAETKRFAARPSYQ